MAFRMGFLRGPAWLLILFICAAALVAPASALAARHRHARSAASSADSGVNDPRYADLVMNPATGEIYHQQSPDARRHPASLTKMMTLYLLFEALESGKITMDDRMPVSLLAASQPQTNLALQPGDTIPVEVAIKSIVVRSANDVAVVISEELGGSEGRFARLMTEKAHQLGMNNTNFENANGLPDDDQYTTARDMAKLGIALKRDFPQYYPYFSTREFSWQGVTYYTHNRVMLRYSGVDGIKTGYIGNSGFNLVTSVVRGGRPLIGVVLGGSTGAWRDNRMIALLNQSYLTLASRGQAKGTLYAQNLPRSRNGQETTPTQAAAGDQRVRSATMVASAVSVSASPETTDNSSSTVPAPPSPNPAKPGANASVVGWGIQVGAFSTKSLAEQAANRALQLSPGLKGSRVALEDSIRVHRARLENISENQARQACETLISNNSPCFIYRAGTQNM